MKTMCLMNSIVVCSSLLTFSIYSTEASGKPSILISSVETQEQDLNSYINRNPDKITYSELMRSENGALSEELVAYLQTDSRIYQNKTRIEIEQITNDQILSNLLNGFLSPLKKKVLITLIKTKVNDSQSKADLIASLDNFRKSRDGTIQLPTLISRRTDQLFVNGELIVPDELSSLRLNQNLFYHFAIISNHSQPIYAWSRAKDFVPVNRKNLAEGSCEKPIFNFDYPGENLVVLYPNQCTTSRFSTSVPDSFQQEVSNKKTSWWDKNRAWALGGSLFIFGTAIYEANRKYDIKISLPF